METLTGTLRTVAESAIQRLGSLRQRVSELLAVHAGQIHTVADGATIIMITHDAGLADQLQRQVRVLDGQVVSDT